jgi:hypothetical protein
VRRRPGAAATTNANLLSHASKLHQRAGKSSDVAELRGLSYSQVGFDHLFMLMEEIRMPAKVTCIGDNEWLHENGLQDGCNLFGAAVLRASERAAAEADPAIERHSGRTEGQGCVSF